MKQNIIYINASGEISFVNPSPEYLLSNSLEDCAIKGLPVGSTYKIVNENLIPSDFTFFAAWEILGSANEVAVNPDKAKAIWKDKWRNARKPLFASLDIEFMKAVESADTTKQAEIALKKQALRDVTQTEITGTTPEEIKAVWPNILQQ